MKAASGLKEVTLGAPVTNGTSPAAPQPRRSKRWYWIAGALSMFLVLGIAFVLRPKLGPAIATAPVVRKTLVTVVTASGTVNPQDTISVGAQVSGTIETIVADYNDHVRTGQVLARLDPTLFQAALDQARAGLTQARAHWQSSLAAAQGAMSSSTAASASADATDQNVGVARATMASADANVDKTRAAAVLTRHTLARDRGLLAAGYLAQSQYDSDYANRIAADSAQSSSIVAARQARMQFSASQSQASAGSAAGSASAYQATESQKTAAADLAAIDSAQALVRQATINLSHTIVTSPVDGTVIARNVSTGQTVAASFQTPVLYTIAKNLAKMEVDSAVGEPDIGSVRVGQRVDLTVLGYPNNAFHGTVAQVRENPTTIANVVTYDTVVYAKNADGRLRPGMTANASIEVARAYDALVVPLAALSFPAPAQQPRNAPSIIPQASPASSWGNTGSLEKTALAVGSVGQVNVVEGRNLRTVPVRITLISGGEAAIESIGGSIAPGSEVAVATAAQAASTPTKAPGIVR